MDFTFFRSASEGGWASIPPANRSDVSVGIGVPVGIGVSVLVRVNVAVGVSVHFAGNCSGTLVGGKAGELIIAADEQAARKSKRTAETGLFKEKPER
jgi:hypothetical protein